MNRILLSKVNHKTPNILETCRYYQYNYLKQNDAEGQIMISTRADADRNKDMMNNKTTSSD